MIDLNAWSPRVLSLLRLITALLFMEHGLMKLFHFPAQQPGVPAGGLPTILMVAAWLEVVGGGLVAIGLFTRPVAFVLSGEMAAAYFMAHMKTSIWPALNGGDAAILFCWVFFFLVFAGGGAWSADALLARKKA